MVLTEIEINKRVSDSYEVKNNVLEAVPTPLVSIRTSTYNHGPYIKQCIEGVLMQKTNFPFEYIIGEDCSTDETREIVFDYAKRYPNIIRVITANYNVGSKANGRRCINACRGKYMAICEGDDYWTDPLKLQKQVDFLEENKEYVMCFHNAKILNESIFPVYFKKVEKREYLCKELYDDWIVPTASIMIITDNLLKKKPDYSKLLNGDIFWVMSAFEIGKVYGMADQMSVYRVQPKGLTIKRVTEDNLKLQFRYLIHYQYLSDEFKQIPVESYKKKMADTYINIAVIFFKYKDLKFIKYLYKGYKMSSSRFLERFKRLLKR